MASVAPAPAKRTRPNAVTVNECQRGNPLLQHVLNVPWEFGPTAADYEVGRTTGVLFLSIRYHKLHPNYIYERLKELGRLYSLRILLVLIDAADFAKTLRELTRVSVVLGFTIVLAWSNEEAGRYLETFKAFENKPADAIQPKTGDSTLERLYAVLSPVRAVNKTDALTLATQFPTVADMLCAGSAELLLCPGFGPQKAQRLAEVMQTCFDPSLYPSPP